MKNHSLNEDIEQISKLAGLSEQRTRYTMDEFEQAFDDIYVDVRNVDEEKADRLLQAMNEVWKVLGS